MVYFLLLDLFFLAHRDVSFVSVCRNKTTFLLQVFFDFSVNTLENIE